MLRQLFTSRRLAMVVLGTLAVLGIGAVCPGAALAANDTIPPTRPAAPTANPVSTTYATINTGGSTDNDRVAGYPQPLTPGTTYTVAVVAFDPSGNRSERSDPVTFTTTSLPTPTCQAVRQVISPTFYILTLTIENMTTSVVTNWTMTFTLPAAQTLTTALSLTRNGDLATLAPTSNTAQITPGMRTTFGFYVNRPTNSPLPSGFLLISPATGSISCAVTDR